MTEAELIRLVARALKRPALDGTNLAESAALAIVWPKIIMKLTQTLAAEGVPFNFPEFLNNAGFTEADWELLVRDGNVTNIRRPQW